MAKLINSTLLEEQLQADIDNCSGEFNKAVLEIFKDYVTQQQAVTLQENKAEIIKELISNSFYAYEQPEQPENGPGAIGRPAVGLSDAIRIIYGSLNAS